MRRLLLILALSLPCMAGNDSNWATLFSQVTLPASCPADSVTGGIQVVFLHPTDGKVYISSRAGICRANYDSVAANPTDSTLWSTINTGLPLRSGGSGFALYVDAQSFVVNSSGNLVAGLGDPSAGGAGVCLCQTKILDENTQTWSGNNVATFESNRTSIRHIERDSTGNLYAQQTGNGHVFKSTDGGSTWTSAVGDLYTNVGLGDGIVYEFKIIGDQAYWGGDGAGSGLVKQGLTFPAGTFTNMLPTNSPCVNTPNTYCHNMGGIASDGTYAVVPAAEIIAEISDGAQTSYVQRYDVPTTIWSAIVPPTVQSNTMSFWGNNTNHPLAKGSQAGEYYLAIGYTSATCTGKSTPGTGCEGVFGTVNGGVTWTLLGNGQTFAAPNTGITIDVSPDDTKFMTPAGSASLWVHPGFPVTTTYYLPLRH